MPKQKVTFQCHQCQQTFEQLIDLEEQPVITGTCPYCNAPWEADLSPRDSCVTIYKNITTGTQSGIKKLPDIILTKKPA